MDSFYGGINGQSFSIKKIFTTKVALDADLSSGWTSTISVGEFVIVSYGMPTDENYETYRQKDLKASGKSYNSTLWQKTFDGDENGSAHGLSYKLISSMTGNTPNIGADVVWEDANVNPYVVKTGDDLDKPVFTFHIPHSWDFETGSVASKRELNVDEAPKVNLSEVEGKTNTLAFDFNFPQN
jgi:hypothetical protein